LAHPWFHTGDIQTGPLFVSSVVTPDSSRPSLESIESIPLHAPELRTRPSLESIRRAPEVALDTGAGVPPYWSQADDDQSYDQCDSVRMERAPAPSAGSFMLHASPIAPERWIGGMSFADEDVRDASDYDAGTPMATSQGFLSPMERRMDDSSGSPRTRSPRTRSPRTRAHDENPPAAVTGFVVQNDETAALCIEHDGLPMAWSSNVGAHHWLDG
jgi:hypothetical protein